MNNTINRMKKRADTLAEYFVERMERLEKENRYLEELNRNGNASFNEMCIRFKGYSMPFNQVLDNVESMHKDKSGLIIIHFKNKHIGEFDIENRLYPIINRLYELYAEKVDYEKRIAERKRHLRNGDIKMLLPQDE